MALSPSGEHVAVFERFIGEDVDGQRDPNRADVLNSFDAPRLSIASVESLVAGDPEWSHLTGFSDVGVTAGLDGQATGVVWTEPNRLWLELANGLFEVELASSS